MAGQECPIDFSTIADCYRALETADMLASVPDRFVLS